MRILLITPLYPIPSPDNKASSVCHFFARQWVREGREVAVVHMQPVYSRPWYLLVRFFGRQLENWAGGGNFYTSGLRKSESYLMDGVKVYRVPIYKPTPHGRFGRRAFSKFRNEVLSLLERDGFMPDVITGHMTPLETVPSLNAAFGAGTCLVMHGVDMKDKSRYPDWKDLLASYDAVGFRSKAVMECFQAHFGQLRSTFMCYSGIPSDFVAGSNPHHYAGTLKSFIFVGQFLERKHPQALMEAIPAACPEYSITFIGDGPQERQLRLFSAEKGMQGRVTFAGRLPRKEILSFYDRSDCFIMISSGEAYGLVYLEAMARGCIVIASRGEGMDGVIEDGVNGFLCPAGDAEALSDLLRHLTSLPTEKLQAVSDAALATAARMTDELVAEDYARALERFVR